MGMVAEVIKRPEFCRFRVRQKDFFNHHHLYRFQILKAYINRVYVKEQFYALRFLINKKLKKLL